LGRWRLLGCLVLVAAGQAPVRPAETPAPANPSTKAVLRIGFSSSVLVDLNENDAKAAIKVWAQQLLMEHGIPVPTEALVLNGGEAIARAVRNKLVDGVTVTAEEYWAVGPAFMSTNAILGLFDGLVTEEYVLLVRSDSRLGRIDDLRGRSLAFWHNGRASLAPVWFETLLLKSGLGETHQFCGRVIHGMKLSQAVLPVFFHQADACVVTRRGFQTMTELNPQVGRQLKVLASSPALVPVAFLFRADYSDPARDQIIANVAGLHPTAASQQVFALFQCDLLEVRPVSALDSALALLAAHARLAEGANHPEPAHAGVPLASGKAGGS
jgi:phosphonate transport system substrate-binding protein